MTRKQRALILTMAVALVFVMLFSSFFIAKNAKHTCIGEDCPICQELEVCENTLHTAALLAVAVVAFCFFSAQPAIARPRHGFGVPFFTLVSLKVKLSN